MNRDELIKIMCDRNAYEEEREEASGYLTNFPDEISLEALSKVAKNKNESAYVRAKAGESMGLIMITIGKLEEKYLDGIKKEAKAELMAVFRDNQLDWYKKIAMIIRN